MLVINRVNASNESTPAAREYIEYSGTSGTTVLITTRNVDSSNSALTHAVGSIVEFIPDVTWADRIYDALANVVDVDTLAVDTTKVVTPASVTSSSIVLSGSNYFSASGATISLIKDEDDMASNSATALATQQSIKAYVDTYGQFSSMARQAIINGNFDVWQRGTSIALTAANGYTADRWYVETATAGTDKTVSREDGTGVNGSYYCARVKMVSDVDELLTFSQALESQDSIKFRGKKATLSFYARGGAEFVADNATLVSKIVTGKGTDQKVLAFTTSADAVSQNNTLTTSWVKFTCTTSAVIAADITQIGVSFSFTHAGSGTTTNYFEVTQVQLCMGDVALPFQPKSYENELRACQRYYYRKSSNATYTSARLSMGQVYSSSQAIILTEFPVTMRTIPTPGSGGTLGLNQPNTAISGATLNTIVDGTPYNCNVAYQGASGLTAGHATMLSANADANAYIDFSAEL